MAWAGTVAVGMKRSGQLPRDISEGECARIGGGWKRGKRQVLRPSGWLRNPLAGIPWGLLS